MIRKARYEPEDLLTMPDGDRYELLDGQLVERPMSFWSNYVAGRILVLLNGFASKVAWVVWRRGTVSVLPA